MLIKSNPKSFIVVAFSKRGLCHPTDDDKIKYNSSARINDVIKPPFFKALFAPRLTGKFAE